jgi:predicted TIM-barrel fold metal-dependent hydrolase
MKKPSFIHVARRRFVGWSLRHVAVSGLLLAFGACPFLVSAGYGSDVPEWPQEREDRLSVVESQILDVQRELFRARVTNDETKKTELEKRMKELEKEQVKLLRASGQFPPR